MGNPDKSAGKGLGQIDGDERRIEETPGGTGDGSNEAGSGGVQAGETESVPAQPAQPVQTGPVEKRRRGRPSKAEAEQRAGSNAGAAKPKEAVGLKTAREKPKAVSGTVLNDRKKFAASVGALHGMAAIFLKQPAIQLSDMETVALSEAVCAVCDYHGVDLDKASGPFGLYVSLAATVAGIYGPRALALAQIRKAAKVRPAAPATPADILNNAGGVDFTGNVAMTEAQAPNAE